MGSQHATARKLHPIRLLTAAALAVVLVCVDADHSSALPPSSGRPTFLTTGFNGQGAERGGVVTGDGGLIVEMSGRGGFLLGSIATGSWHHVPVNASSGGRAIDISHDRLAQGRPSTTQSNSDRVSVYGQNGDAWLAEFDLLSPSPQVGGGFGSAVGLGGDRLVVGEPGRDTVAGGADVGRAYVFERSGGVWGLVATLSAPAGVAGDRFGAAVAVEGDVVVVGAPGRDGGGSDSGGLFVFGPGPGGWGLVSELSSGVAGDGLGRFVDVDAGRVVSAAGGDAAVFADGGSGWALEARLAGGVSVPAGAPGSPVDVLGDRLVVQGGPDGAAGVVSVYERDGSGWGLLGVVGPSSLVGTPEDPSAGFGSGVALVGSGERLVVGAPLESSLAPRAGMLFDFELDPLPAGVSVGDVTVTSSASKGVWVPASFPVSLSEPQATDTTVSFETRDGTAVAGEGPSWNAQAGYDYVARAGSVTIPAGQVSATVVVWTRGDGFFEGPIGYGARGFEQFSVELTGVSGSPVGVARRFGVGTIWDSVPGLSVGDVGGVEPDDPGSAALGWVTFSLDAPAAGPVEVTYTTGDGTAASPGDYLTRTDTVTIPAGKAHARVQVWVRGDTTAEPEEAFEVRVTAVTGATLADDGIARAAIIADE